MKSAGLYKLAKDILVVGYCLDRVVQLPKITKDHKGFGFTLSGEDEAYYTIEAGSGTLSFSKYVSIYSTQECLDSVSITHDNLDCVVLLRLLYAAEQVHEAQNKYIDEYLWDQLYVL